MSTPYPLSRTQRAIIEHAIHHHHGQVAWFPDRVKGGARHQVLRSLFQRALICRDAHGGWTVDQATYDAMGLRQPADTPLNPELEALLLAAEANWTLRVGHASEESA